MNKVALWFRRTFADGQMLLVLFLVISAFIGVTFFASMFAPAIAAVVIAFLLDGPVEWLARKGARPLVAQVFVFLIFLLVASIFILEVFPPLARQIILFVGDTPAMIGEVRDAILDLRTRVPDLVSEDQLRGWFSQLGDEIASLGPSLVAFSVSGVTGTITLIIYLVLVPTMVFFFLKDKREILDWCNSFLPADKPVLDQIWVEVTQRAGDYARGKVYQILIVGMIAFIVYQAIGLRYATLLAVATGLSVIVPYIGAAAVTFPIALVAYLQWDLSGDFVGAMVAYFIIQAFDGNVLYPLLFSGVVKLHPNAIIIAVLFFGGIWGFWGLFFAIPLATVANAVLRALRDYDFDEQALAQSKATEAPTTK